MAQFFSREWVITTAGRGGSSGVLCRTGSFTPLALSGDVGSCCSVFRAFNLSLDHHQTPLQYLSTNGATEGVFQERFPSVGPLYWYLHEANVTKEAMSEGSSTQDRRTAAVFYLVVDASNLRADFLRQYTEVLAHDVTIIGVR